MKTSDRISPSCGTRRALAATGLRLPAFCFTALLILGSLCLVCLKSPAEPSWDTQLTLPLLQNTYHLMDILPRNYFSVGTTQ